MTEINFGNCRYLTGGMFNMKIHHPRTWKNHAAVLMAVTALCTAAAPFTALAAGPVTASEVNISIKGGTRGLTESGITPGHVYASTDGWSEGAAGNTNSVAMGGGQVGSMSTPASVRGQNSVAVGAGASVDVSTSQNDFNSANATAIGTTASVSAMQGTAVGYGSKVTGAQGTAIGEQSAATAAGSAAFGEGSHAKAEKSTAIGTGANVGDGAKNSVALGADSTVYSSDLKSTDKNGVVSLGSGNAERRIIHVADGVNNSDAATVGQLAKATEKSNAAVTANEKKIGSANLSNGSADLTEGINTNTASIQQNSTAIQENTSAIQQNSNAITSLNTHVRSLGQEIDSVGALSAALAGLHPIDYDGSGSRFQISAAAGTYDGKQAVALGGFYHVNRDVMFSLGASSTFGNDRKAAGNFGVTFRVGPGASQSPSQTSSDVEELRAEVEALKAEIQALKAR